MGSRRRPGLLSVVIPAHNEEGHIAETVHGLAATLRRPASPTKSWWSTTTATMTPSAISGDAERRRHPRVRYVNNLPPNGFGFAVRRGLAEFRGDAVAMLMADGSDDPADLVAFYRKLRKRL